MLGANCRPLRVLRAPRTPNPGHILNARSQLYATSCSSCSQSTTPGPLSECLEPKQEGEVGGNVGSGGTARARAKRNIRRRDSQDASPTTRTT
eukprot:2775937-Pyramimonas_sp.AAC.1